MEKCDICGRKWHGLPMTRGMFICLICAAEMFDHYYIHTTVNENFCFRSMIRVE